MAEIGNEIKFDKSGNISDVISFIFIKKLITRIPTTEAYKLGLVDINGVILKEPETDKEKDALTLIDKLVFRLKRLLGPKISKLNNFLYVQTLGSNFLNNLVVRGGIEQRAVVKRVKGDIQRIKEQYNITDNDILNMMIYEDILENTDSKGNFLGE